MKRFLCVLCVICATSAYAQDELQMKLVEERFKNADKNGDNQVTLEESENGMPRVAAHFNLIDKDKNGFVIIDEIKAALASN
jgi:hypothetical protein